MIQSISSLTLRITSSTIDSTVPQRLTKCPTFPALLALSFSILMTKVLCSRGSLDDVVNF